MTPPDWNIGALLLKFWLSVESAVLIPTILPADFPGARGTTLGANNGNDARKGATRSDTASHWVVTRAEMPLGYEVFAGNRTDVTTVEEIVATMEQRYGLAQRIWVMDRVLNVNYFCRSH